LLNPLARRLFDVAAKPGTVFEVPRLKQPALRSKVAELQDVPVKHLQGLHFPVTTLGRREAGWHLVPGVFLRCPGCISPAHPGDSTEA